MPQGQAAKVTAALAQLAKMKKQALDLTHNLKAQAKELNKGQASNRYQSTTMAFESLIVNNKKLHEELESKYAECDLDSTNLFLVQVESQQEEMHMLVAAANSALRMGAQKLKAGPAALAMSKSESKNDGCGSV